jgi:ferritin-like metal-binding protein YciE
MEHIKSLDNLLLREIKDLYDAEKQLVKALPKVVKKASSPELKRAIEDHLRQTEGHVSRLEHMFEIFGEPAKAVKCRGMQGILEEAEETMKQASTPETLDVAIVASAQKVEHYEITAYGSAIAWAETLGRHDLKTLLAQTIEEEKKADQKLSELARSNINQRATSGGSESRLAA